MKILVADDDPVSRRLMQSMLERGGYEVIVAADGLAASLELCRPDGPRLAVIDWMMPELDGPEVCRRVRSRQDAPYVFILLLTSKQSNEDTVAGLEAGADDYLTKPCNAEELRARLLTGQRILQLEDTLVEAREAMHFRATHDGLTQLWNRSAVLALLQKAIERSMNGGNAISILLCDIDHFKQINDGHGHPVGDEVLEQFALRLKNGVRATDWVGRYGGEEFLLVLNDCKAAHLWARAEHIRTIIAQEPFATKAGFLNVSTSIGAITFDGLASSMSLESMVKQADTALYRAKSLGRNRVQLVDQPLVLTKSQD
ncbi:diguanylate cyclase [Granulicella mallensis]|uniref:diguanylate cyclase n=1 Tax=Granulicella mallensis (strain ATCC BAA-1857 / DSM 23137 / MP5ACTX8) TaxID=682795 RepID=G8NVD1_GRAMM|nr:diguanylate cyclase [Granulicella mallensis]AEU36512.1 response regulator receiver modulated diguanylate cyclase [Granulicella mallensis MP5ACTX8]